MNSSDTDIAAKAAVGSDGKVPRILTRIYITPEGDLVVTDLWDEVRGMLSPLFGEESEI